MRKHRKRKRDVQFHPKKMLKFMLHESKKALVKDLQTEFTFIGSSVLLSVMSC
jgi:hypothetical protein